MVTFGCPFGRTMYMPPNRRPLTINQGYLKTSRFAIECSFLSSLLYADRAFRVVRFVSGYTSTRGDTIG